MDKFEKIRIEIQLLKKLPTLSYTAEKILNITAKESTHLDELVKIIENDTPIISKVLGVANIMYFGYSGSITNIKDAVLKIGFNNLKNIALSISIFTLFKTTKQRERTYRKLYRHSIATGVICNFISEKVIHEVYEDSFTAGILHDLGLFALHYLYYDAFIKIEDLVLQGKTLTEAENEVIETDHSIIGKWLADWWGLPEEIADVILFHHENPGILDLDNKYKKIVAIVHLSNYIAETLGYGVFDRKAESKFYEAGVYSILPLPEVQDLINQIKSELSFEELVLL